MVTATNALIIEVKDLSRNSVIKAIKHNLEARSGKTWSVTGGRGTGSGWLTIDAPPARRKYDWDGTPIPADATYGYSSIEDRTELANLLGLTPPLHAQGQMVGASHDYYREYIERSAGRTPTKIAQPYWD